MKRSKANPAIVEMQELVNALSDEVQALRDTVEQLREEHISQAVTDAVARERLIATNAAEYAFEAKTETEGLAAKVNALALGEMDMDEVERIAREHIQRVVDERAPKDWRADWRSAVIDQHGIAYGRPAFYPASYVPFHAGVLR